MLYRLAFPVPQEESQQSSKNRFRSVGHYVDMEHPPSKEELIVVFEDQREQAVLDGQERKAKELEECLFALNNLQVPFPILKKDVTNFPVLCSTRIGGNAIQVSFIKPMTLHFTDNEGSIISA